MPINVRKRAQLNGHRAPVYALCGAGVSHFFSAGGDGTLMCWNANDAHADVVAHVNGSVFSMLHQPDANHLLAGTLDGFVHVIDLSNGKTLHKLSFGNLPVFALSVFPASASIGVLSGSGALTMLGYDYETIGNVALSQSSLRCVAWHPNGKRFAIGSSDKKIYLNHDPMGDAWQVLDDAKHSVFSVAYDHSGKYLVAGSRDASLYLYDAENDYELKHVIPAHMATVNHLQRLEPHALVASAGRDKHVKLWDTTNWQLLKVIDHEKLDGHTRSVNRLLWMEQESLLISASDDRSLMLWQVDVT